MIVSITTAEASHSLLVVMYTKGECLGRTANCAGAHLLNLKRMELRPPHFCKLFAFYCDDLFVNSVHKK